MGEKQDRLGLGVPAPEPGHQVALRREVVRHQHVNILGRQAGIEQRVRHRLGCARVVAPFGVRRVDLDELFQEATGQRHVLGRRQGLRRRGVLCEGGRAGAKQHRRYGENRYREFRVHPR